MVSFVLRLRHVPLASASCPTGTARGTWRTQALDVLSSHLAGHDIRVLRSLSSILSPRQLWRAWPFWLKVAVVLAVVFALSAAGTSWTGDRGDFTSWLSSVATALAVVVAMFAARYAANAWVLETRREDRWLGGQERLQAVLVAAWGNEFLWGLDKFGNPYTEGEITGAHVRVRNGSQLPVWNVAVELYAVSRLNDATIGRNFLGVKLVEVLTPEETVSVWVRATKAFTTPVPDGSRVGVGVDLRFQDSSGLRWHRSQGDLVKVTD